MDISQIRKSFPYSPLEPPKIDNEPVFKTNNMFGKFSLTTAAATAGLLEMLAKKLLKIYGGAIPEESEGLLIVKAALAH